MAMGVGECLRLEITTYRLGHFLLYAILMMLAVFVYTATEPFTASDGVLSSHAFCDFLTYFLISHYSMHVYIPLIP